MTVKKKFGFYGALLMVAVCSMVVGMFIASSLKIDSVSQAIPFWKEGSAPAQMKVPLPSFSSLAKEVTPTVVNIRTTKNLANKDIYRKFEPPPGYDEWFDDFFKKFFNNIPEQDLQQRSLGSGFIISADGYVLTNNHVVTGADEIFVSLADKEEFKAKVVGTDDKTDIALIKITAEKYNFPVAVLGDSDALEIGEWVIAIGNPFGFGHTLTQGIVSAKSRVIGAGPYDNFIQTDAAINPGNSGGPLMNMQGQVVGINTAIVASGQGIGFATPINMAKEILSELKDKGEVARGWLGVAIQEVTPEIARAVGMKEPKGAMVTTVYAGDPADKAGIKPGDIILKINSQEVTDSRSLTRMIGSLKPDVKITITVWRDSRTLDLSTNQITDLSNITTVPSLRWLYLAENYLTTINPLTAALAPNLYDVDLRHSFLDTNPSSQASAVILQLQTEGVTVDYLPQQTLTSPSLSAPMQAGVNQFRFTINSLPAQVYQVQSSTDLI
ncbi:MAG: Do family serine endopeptidase, partial [Desulfomonilia bacterium]